ncbi:hypothetical protein [Labrys monachus]|uniref:Uncharacterized protein n=1 Tax=Labrys monachus TaxID=217067 RepID=A0ABU0FP05_9HYPH|nr:hypothetical protein [Labrys monachus]MDQ0396337.1 hypothetical protein [Labrys monachus]
MSQDKPRKFDPRIIDVAPVEPGDQDFDPAQSGFYLRFIGELSEENASLKSELEKIKGRKTFDDVRTELLTPYANKVFWFLCVYCVAVLSLLVKSGEIDSGFKLGDQVLSILSGSTAVSAIGLVGIVVRGLFYTSKSKAMLRSPHEDEGS